MSEQPKKVGVYGKDGGSSRTWIWIAVAVAIVLLILLALLVF